ncbi:MAG: GGDEF domain-containing protein [Limnobacter sp.]|nr:GGDEF domain-containing protein [Limnobacter sp.]
MYTISGIHLPTLYLIGALAGVPAMLLLMATSAQRLKDRPAVTRFCLAIGAGSLALALLWAHGREPIPVPTAIPAAGIAGMAQAVLLARAAAGLFGARLAWTTAMLVLLGGSASYLLAAATGAIWAAVAIVVGLQGGLYAMAAVFALRARDPAGPVFRFAFGLQHGIVALLTLLRGGELLVRYAAGLGHDGGMFADSGLNQLYALSLAMSPLLTALLVMGVLNARLANRLLQVSLTDELTGIRTRRHLTTEAPRLMQWLQASGRRAAVLMIDLDNFKQINDTWGHTIGDRALRYAALSLQKELRSDSLIARYGGEEFCAIVPVNDAAEAMATAERLRASLAARPALLGGRTIRLTVSIGVAVQGEIDDFDALLECADARVYEAKARGRNCVVGGSCDQATARSQPPAAAPDLVQAATTS